MSTTDTDRPWLTREEQDAHFREVALRHKEEGDKWLIVSPQFYRDDDGVLHHWEEYRLMTPEDAMAAGIYPQFD